MSTWIEYLWSNGAICTGLQQRSYHHNSDLHLGTEWRHLVQVSASIQ